MKCFICNGYHLPGESCPEKSSGDLFSSLRIPSFEPLKPVLPTFEPPPLIELNKVHFEPLLPAYEPPSFELPKPILPTIEPPQINFDFLSKPEPLIPPPSPVYNFHNDLIGWKPEFDNHINLGIGGNGTRLEIDPGGFVRDPMGHLIGEMGPLNTMMPPSFPSMPDYGPPQSTPDAWDPGFSPIKPFG